MTAILRERNYMLDELGDPTAPVGSRLWCLWVANEIRKTIDTGDQVSQALRDLTAAFKENQAWQELGCLSWDDFCVKYLHRPAGRVDVVLSTPVVYAQRAKPPHPNGTNQYTVIGLDNSKTLDGENGNSSAYLTARIARDRPDILEGMKQGEYRSVRAAAIEAGIINPTLRYSLPGDPVAAARYLAQRVDAEWWAAFDAERLVYEPRNIGQEILDGIREIKARKGAA